jgi:glycosyltransferase involved in cell wall biosynthesis
LGAAEPFAGVEPGRWQTVGRAAVRYVQPREQSVRGFRQIIAESEAALVYLNSAFDPRFTLRVVAALGSLPRASRPALLIAPRGEFGSGALALKAWKKTLFLLLARFLRFYGDATWHASTELEAVEIQRALGISASRIRTAVDLAAVPQALARVGDATYRAAGASANDRLRVVFVSRISPIKNLPFALESLCHVAYPMTFTVVGPIEDVNHWDTCLAQVQRLPGHVEFVYAGAVPHEDVSAVLAQQDLFFLPTSNENFGHVILEALLAGTPVLVSDRTPWRGLQALGVGWDLPLDDPVRFAQVLDSFAQMPIAERIAMRRRAGAYARRLVDDPAGVDANRLLFRAAARRN